MATSIEELKLNVLRNYSACDVSDALLKLQKLPEGTTARAGHIVDLVPFSPTIARSANLSKIIAPASTFKFIPKSDPIPIGDSGESHGFPAGTHWVDFAEPGTVAVIEQPAGQHCAVLGGIMAVRMKYLGVKGVVVNGRVRDLGEISECQLPVWARATSSVGTAAEAKPGARNVPVSLGGVTVAPGDIVFCDPLEGVVAIPRELLDQVLELMPKLVAMDDNVKEAVRQGSNVFDAFKKFRTKI
ncbi:ribonuclease E inhibitor RraA/Dimethylmenaquinone methyltransferase [Aspergillus coremiiformis]|uniref:Ribonuclease E inhibitor RraA/Dimethylmenaquinone methyltransferase n=1 Tax=Aspergillus coremiiformis TaxID=138285 RepID=A0A5N6YZ10_9EURO|nr:ribonuclease E inhibitor RraA/Dimethylmenaquinone methyltransferase [Aspergillus coremiiformis]